jgi:hypothetical protein
MRSHSVSAEGGTAAVIFEEEGDNQESHIDFSAQNDPIAVAYNSIKHHTT